MKLKTRFAALPSVLIINLSADRWFQRILLPPWHMMPTEVEEVS